MNGFQYNPFTPPVTPLWIFSSSSGTTFSFDLDSATVITNTPNPISLSVSGILFATGALNRDPTPVVFDFTASNPNGNFDHVFAFTRPVPEPGTVALALLGMGLVGFKFLRRKVTGV